MKQLLVKGLISLYPPEWRRRYGAEYAALLEDCPLAPLDLLDIGRGAIDAHLHPAHYSLELPDPAGPFLARPQPNYRRAILVGFGAYIGFVLAGLNFYEMVDDSRFVPMMRAHLALKLCWQMVMAGAALALLAVLIGGGPIVLSVLRQAWRGRRWELLFLLFSPAVILLNLIGVVLLTSGAVWLTGAKNSETLRSILLFCWILLFILGAIASTSAVCLAVVRARVNQLLFRLALYPAALAAAAMLVMLVGTTGFGLVAALEGPSLTGDEMIGWLVTITGMACSSSIATFSVMRGFAHA